ncbi:hypothetical protein FQN55_005577 [Onygenales sp. PD_40]|nr:hypothetical protein FQN55_005577 [Onygenales sp. PD_40]KAK2755808.1 hypothetical protein FQN53_008792 [Emmonsiellopsis sp. PD_33]KAK2777811.1 hypothetical protein FQN52_002984 [Onygenales sp. PD_12]
MHLMAWFKRHHKPGANQPAVSSTVEATRGRKSAPRAGSLQRLPEELLAMICQQLTPAEAITLMLSCARFWRGRTGTGVFGKIWQEIMLPVGKKPSEKLSNVATRFYILRMLEYDGLLQRGSQRLYCCWGCMKPHKRQAFSRKELKKKVNLRAEDGSYPGEDASRSCLLVKRYIWMGVCREMSLAELRHVISHPHTQKLVCGLIYLRDNHENSFRNCSFIDPKTGRMEYKFHICRARDFQTVPGSFWHARAADIPLCPHIRTSSRRFRKLCRSPIGDKITCKHCRTIVKIELSQFITIHVSRYLGSLRSLTDRRWMAQSYQTKHRRLEDHCRSFYDWVQYTNKCVAEGVGYEMFPKFRSARKIHELSVTTYYHYPANIRAHPLLELAEDAESL